MASTIKDIVTEAELITEAFEDTNGFIYGFPWDMNATRNKNFPVVLLSRVHPYSIPELSKPDRIYDLQVSFFNTFLEGEKKQNIEPETKMEVLEKLARQWMEQFSDRSLGLTTEQTVSQDWFIPNPQEASFIQIYERLDDKLLELLVRFKVQLHGDCGGGTFNF